MKNYMTKEIKSIEDAKRFICDLYFDGNMFHFASDAYEIVDIKGERAFDDETAKLLDKRVDEVFNYIKDPFQLCLALVEESYNEQ